MHFCLLCALNYVVVLVCCVTTAGFYFSKPLYAGGGREQYMLSGYMLASFGLLRGWSDPTVVVFLFVATIGIDHYM